MTCHFRAEMEEEVELAKVTTVEVTISREEIEKLTGPAGASGAGDVDPGRKLILQLLAKVNLDAVGDSRVELMFQLRVSRNNVFSMFSRLMKATGRFGSSFVKDKFRW